MAVDIHVEDLPAGQKPISPRLLQTLGRVLLGLATLAAIAGIYAAYGFVQAQNRIVAEQRENAANAAVVATAVNDLQTVQRQFADKTAQDCASVATLSHWIRSLSSPVRNSLPNIAGVLTTLDRLCGPGHDGYVATDLFLTNYVPAVTARQSRDYEAAGALYQKAADTRDVQSAMKARAYEGLAYSNLKLGKLDAAEAAAQTGRRLGVDYVYTEVTALKLACARKLPAVDVRQQFDAARTEREKVIASAPNGPLKDIATADLRLLLNDPELASTCRYAALPLKG